MIFKDLCVFGVFRQNKKLTFKLNESEIFSLRGIFTPVFITALYIRYLPVYRAFYVAYEPVVDFFKVAAAEKALMCRQRARVRGGQAEMFAYIDNL